MLEGGEAFRRAILENPADNTPRLVYADWLDEFGTETDQARAAFVRAQVEAANGAELENLQLWNLLHHSEQWFPDVCKSLGLGVSHWGVMHDGTVHFEHKSTVNEFFVRRGFVDEIRVPLVWMLGAICGRCGGRGCFWCDCGQVGGCRSVLEAEPVRKIVVGNLRIEIEPPGPDYGWQAYFYRGDEESYTDFVGGGLSRDGMLNKLFEYVSSAFTL